MSRFEPQQTVPPPLRDNRQKGRGKAPRRRERGRDGPEDKERQTERVGGWGRSCSPEGFSWCLTPLVLLMCDAQEIDRLCRTEPTGENNNNNNNKDRRREDPESAELRRRGGGATSGSAVSVGEMKRSPRSRGQSARAVGSRARGNPAQLGTTDPETGRDGSPLLPLTRTKTSKQPERINHKSRD